MSIVSGKTEGNTLFAVFTGRIDSSNADMAEAELNSVLETEGYEKLILDFENLEYISSAGLRIILRLRKNHPDLTVINVSNEVYEIFDMTGFTEMINIEKAYRVLSVEGCEIIGQGSNGEVYRLDPDTIIKVYKNPDCLDDIRRERELARRAFVLGIPTAIPYDVVRVGNTYGSVFEMLNAKSFTKLIAENPDKVDYYIDLYVDLMKKIHSTLVKKDDMPDMREVAIGWAKYLENYLPKDMFDKLVSLVEGVPEDLHMMHGDYHTKNLMMQGDEVLLIDMDTLCYGHPVFELASVFNAYLGFSEINRKQCEKFIGLTYETGKHIWERTLSLYFDTEDKEFLESVEKKAKLVGYMRILRRTIRRYDLNSEEGKNAVEIYKNLLLGLIDQVDSLVF